MRVRQAPKGLVSQGRNLDRLRQISEVAVRHGFGYLFERHNLWTVLALSKREVPPAPPHLGRHVREFLEELGPTFVKFGQLLSTRPDLVPHEVLQQLVRLQDNVSPFPFERVRAVVEEELGLTLERLFTSFDPVPIAAASIGQVHRAVLPGGIEVVVKVQRPDAAHQIQRDIELLEQAASLMRDHLGERLFADPVAVVQEFARSISAELDYTLEGRNAERFASHFSGSESVSIPRVYWTHSRRRVLTLEHMGGTTLNLLDLEELGFEQRSRLAESIADAWFKQILEDGFFHADPHPANIMYLEPGRIALLDFGMAGALSREDLEQGTLLFLDVMSRDIEGVKRRLARLGVRWPREKDREVTAALELGFARYFGLKLADLDAGALIREVFDLIYQLHLNLPSRFLLLEKSLLTLEGVATTVYPDLDVFHLARPYARSLLARRYRPDSVIAGAGRSLEAYARVIQEYPFQLHDLLEELRDGELEIKFVHMGLDDFGHKLDVLTNRVVIGLITATLGLASSIVAVFVTGGPHILGLSVWGIPGFFGSFVFGVWLMWAIVRSGRM